jgi:chromate reductase
MSTSPGNFGAVRSLGMLRGILSYLGMIVVPTQLAIPRASTAFDAQGHLTDEQQAKTVRSIGAEVVTFLRKLR